MLVNKGQASQSAKSYSAVGGFYFCLEGLALAADLTQLKPDATLNAVAFYRVRFGERGGVIYQSPSGLAVCSQ
ncbi:hypothetical protein [Pseudomonas urmiensis]|jgi:hypothetical protein|uniref:hypothetical protein n=1 Tax=Pseudomonas urmiensis TaxID=2745493 RepID=UPI0034D66A43